MASCTIEIPEGLHHEIQERRHRIDVTTICTEALSAADAIRVNVSAPYRFAPDIPATRLLP
jgi:hypothetical protein